MSIRNPLEQFLIFDIFSISFLSNKVSLTNIGLYLIISLTLIIILSQIVINIKSVIGNKSLLIKESIYDTVHKIVKDQIGEENEIYLPYLYTLFILVLTSNLIGMIPYSFTSTSHLALTLSMSVSILIGVTIIGIQKHKLVFFSLLVPSGTPTGLVPLLVIIETISYVARAVSLGVRLGANMIAGHVLLKILAGFIYKFIKTSYLTLIIGLLPMFIFTLLVGLELGISVLQGIVFVILTSSYIKDAIALH
uniref:ATP synthase subunit a n=1 Tax=Capillidium heterosporum TaxID=1167838 RepID=A0A451F211_9FUNG|nr:ATP synthase F0 subunit 6 [Capillidium heterosporum]AZZ06694.1 ATP synthase F0 subunit 6 [Capillidium heterosporum]